MSKYGITEKGFNKKDFNVLMQEVEEKLKSQNCFGDNVDFSEQDPLRQIFSAILLPVTDLWELAENIFLSSSPKFAEDTVLDNNALLINLLRKQGSRAVGKLKITGEAGTTIQKGFMVQTKSGITFKTTQDCIINTDNTIITTIEALEIGENGNVPENTIVEILTPVLGVNSVTNVQATLKGQDRESDLKFRKRYDKSVSLGATNIYDSIKANILKVTGVKDVIIIENNTMETLNNVPPKSFHVIVLGGEDKEIAQAIFEKFPCGIQPHGTTYVNIKDSMEQEHKIGFSRPRDKEIWINVTLIKNKEYVENTTDIIKDLIVNYINNLGMGENVTLYKVICNVGKVNLQGIEDIQITLSADGKEYNTDNIKVANTEVVKIKKENIEVV